MPEWITYIIIPLISAFIGGGLTLAGVIVTIKWETKNKEQEAIEKVKPIIINTNWETITNDSEYTNYEFTNGSSGNIDVIGYFKNTDNGILFIDYIQSDFCTYKPVYNATIDKNSFFTIHMRVQQGETFKYFDIYCRDVLGNKYCYGTDVVVKRDTAYNLQFCRFRVNQIIG